MQNYLYKASPETWGRLRPKLFGLFSLAGIYDRDYTPFVMINLPRAGSNLLIRALDSNPEIIAREEVLREYEPPLEHVPNKPISSLQNVYLPYPKSVRAVGFKMLLYQQDKSALLWLRSALPELKVIHLVRKNALRTHVSGLIAKQTGKWVDTSKSKPDQGPKKVHVDLDRWKKSLERIENLESGALSYFRGHPIHEIEYDDMVSRWDESTFKLQEFLGVTPIKLSITTRKQNPHPLSELIVNYDEVQQALNGTDKAWMLE